VAGPAEFHRDGHHYRQVRVSPKRPIFVNKPFELPVPAEKAHLHFAARPHPFYEFASHHFDSPASSNLAYTISATDIHFTSTSKDFIAYLYSVANVLSDDMLSFVDCEIPTISHLQDARNLYLENIPDDEGLSLRNILAAWEGSQITIRSCPSFNDTFLLWLQSEGEYRRLNLEGNGILMKTFSAANLTSLCIENCVDFTIPALLDVIRFRRDTHTAFSVDTDTPPYISPIYSLSVTGRGPMLTQEAKNWFNGNRGNISVAWHTEDDEVEVHGFSL
jgi:hypothetical protein